MQQKMLFKCAVTGYAVDSRKVTKGSVFLALKGKNLDGHHFLKEVAAKGAVGAVVSKEYQGPAFGLTLIRVEDVLEWLQTMARDAQMQRGSQVIAVTGSMGKTTTKEFIATLLERKFKVAKTPGNANSQIGLPLAILNGAGGEEVLIAEMGMTEAGGIAKLVQIVPPDIAVITKIGHAHVSSFPDGLEGVARAKAEVLSHPKTKLCIINAQAMQFQALRKELLKTHVTYGVDPYTADYVLKKGPILEEHGKEGRYFELPFEETHFCENFAAAATVARQLGVEWEEIFERAKLLKGFMQRFEKIEREGVLYINDCYNANPESMRAALDNLPKPRLGAKTVAVFAEMPGLGPLSEKCHQELSEYALKRVDHMFCYGKGCLPMLRAFEQAGRPVEFFNDLQKMRKALFELSKPGDVVLIKGRNDDKLWQLLEG